MFARRSDLSTYDSSSTMKELMGKFSTPTIPVSNESKEG